MKNSLFLIKDFISKETLSGLILFVVTVLAVTIANSDFGSYYFELFSTQLGINFGQLNASMSLLHWINDVLMAIFFLVVGLEIKREMLIGELSSVKKASFPIIAAIGGMIVPAILYISLNPDHITGFGVPMATDIAFALGILMLLGNKVNPAIKLFLVTLAVVDDLGAIVVVAIFYTNELHFEYFLYAFAVYSIIWFLNYKNVQKLTPYIILGVFLWIFIHKTGIHSTIAGVLLAFAIPLNKKADLEESVEHLSVDNPLVKLEHALHNFSAFIIMPLFAFANAGVIIDFSNVIEHQLIVLGVAIGLIIGKPIGIFSFTYLATKLKISVKPENVTWNDIFAVGFLGGIGFTMSIFISHLAFSDQTIVGVIAAIIGSVLLILKAKKVQS